MGEEGEEEVGKKKRRSARILELEGEKKKKIKDKKEVKEQGEGSTNKLKVKSKSEVEEGPKQDHEEHEEEQEKTEEEQNPSTREAVEAPTVNEETLEDVDVAFVASPSQQDIMDASQPDHTDTQSDQQPTDPSMHTPLPAQSSAPSELSVDTLTTSETFTSNRKKGRGPAKGLKLAKRAQESTDGKLDIEFSDKSNSAVGPNQRMFVDEVVQQMRTYAPLNVKKWAEVPQEAKDNIVAAVLGRWRVPDTPLRRASILQLANRRYRGWRAKLSKDYSKYDNDEDRRQNRPKEVTEQQWESLIAYFGTDDFKRDPLTGQQPSEYRTWLLCHRHCDGTWSDDNARQIYEQVNQLITQKSEQEGVPLSSSTEDELFHSVIGSRPGHVRGQRLGLIPVQKEALGEVQMERDALEEQLGEMKLKLQEESAARSVIQAQLQAESAARAEMEARLQAESAARTAMEARLRAEFMVALDSLRSQASTSSLKGLQDTQADCIMLIPKLKNVLTRTEKTQSTMK